MSADINNVSRMPNSMERKCMGCKALLVEPYIKCNECDSPFHVCLICFSKGYESGSHASDHSYQIFTNSFPVLELGWSAGEEIKLLDALADCGPGNWDSIAFQVKTKTKQQCESHYMKFYVINRKYPLPDMPNPPIRPHSAAIPFKACEDPCRPLPDSHRAQHMAGYLAARGDFVEEYDNYAEYDVSRIYFSPNDWPILKSLKLTVVKIYQSRLKERARRKQIIKKFGLINLINHMLLYVRKLPPEILELEVKMRPLMQLQLHPISHDKMLNALALEKQLQQRVLKLKDYRKNGITSYRVAQLYDRLRKERKGSKIKVNFMSEILPYLHDPVALAHWLQRQGASVEGGTSNFSSTITSSIIPNVRKFAPPIDLTGLPGIEKLTPTEKEFCAQARFVPEAYLSYKMSLVNEYRRNGTIKLGVARNVVKIDVNKTRKLFDFLIEQGHIEQK